MNLFDQLKQHVLASRLMSLVAIILLLLSVSLTVRMTQLQQDLRQRAAPSCQANAGADCGNNGKSCCSGMACVPKDNGNGGKCAFVPTPTPTTYIPPQYEAPTSTPTPGQQTGDPIPTSTEGGGIGGVADPTPVPVVCGPNGCGWSPRPEGEKSTTNAPGVQVCTMSFNGPKQLIGTRLSSTSIRFNWWPAPGGADKQFIMYGLQSGSAQWGFNNISGDQGSIVVDHLPANRTIWAQVRAYRGNCYEDTGWVSVGSVQARQNTTALAQTVVLSPTITVQPTSISMNSASYFASSTPEPEEKPAYLNWLILLGLLLLIAFIFRRFLFLLYFKKRRKKKEEHTP